MIDEHDFYAGDYLDADKKSIEIIIEAVITDLNDEQKRYFRDHLEWWNEKTNALVSSPPPEQTDQKEVKAALRVGFTGTYDSEEDDFKGSTYFLSPTLDDNSHVSFRASDKRIAGFLFLRTLRTGSRALSLERGSLLDVILRLQEKRDGNKERLKMWEDLLNKLRTLPVADHPGIGITGILVSLQNAIRSYVPSDWADNPHMRVSDLTRENLRRNINVFMSTGAKCQNGLEYAAPFHHQGTGTINTLVLALLSIIAELKQNVIFAMEEPEIAIPPFTQKRVVNSLQKKSAQAIFTSHSPYILEEFKPHQILVLKKEKGALTAIPTNYPPNVKPKAYLTEIRTRFCEALLARRVLIVEGQTEYDALPVASRRLNELRPETYKTLELLGIAVVNATSDTQILPLGNYFIKLGKAVFAIFDKQDECTKAAIQAAIPNSYESPEKGFENLILHNTKESALRRWALNLVKTGQWPSHLSNKIPTPTISLELLIDALHEYLRWAKGSSGAAALLAECELDEIPAIIVNTLSAIQAVVEPSSPEADETRLESVEPETNS